MLVCRSGLVGCICRPGVPRTRHGTCRRRLAARRLTDKAAGTLPYRTPATHAPKNTLSALANVQVGRPNNGTHLEHAFWRVDGHADE